MASEFFKSKSTMFGLTNDNLLGDLLTKSGVINPNKLKEISQLPSNKRLSIGQMLLVGGYISKNLLDVAQKAEANVKDRVIDQNTAIYLIQTSSKTGQTFEQLFDQIQNQNTKSSTSNKLGDLLVETCLIGANQLDFCLKKSQTTGLPLGRVLVLNNYITDSLLNSALELQIRIRDNMLDKNRAIKILQFIAQGDSSNADTDIINQANEITNINSRNKARLGELLLNLGILNEIDIINALEIQLETGQLFGQILIYQGFITQALLDATLYIQQKLIHDILDFNDAIECLKLYYNQSYTIEDALFAICSNQITQNENNITTHFYELLTLSDLISQEQLDEAFNYKTKSAQIILQILNITNCLDLGALLCSIKIYYMMSKGIIDKSEAIDILNYVKKEYIQQNATAPELETILNKLGWHKNQAPKTVESHSSVNTKSLQEEQASNEVASQAVISSIEEAESQINSYLQESQAITQQETIDIEELTNFAFDAQDAQDFETAQRYFEQIINLKQNDPQYAQDNLLDDYSNLASCLCASGQFHKAEPMMVKIISTLAKTAPVDLERLSESLEILAGIFWEQAKYDQSLPLLERSLKIKTQTYGANSLEVAQLLKEIAKVLQKQGNEDLAQEKYNLARKILASIQANV